MAFGRMSPRCLPKKSTSCSIRDISLLISHLYRRPLNRSIMKSQYANYDEEVAACRKRLKDREFKLPSRIESFGEWFRKESPKPNVENADEFRQAIDNSFRDKICPDSILDMEPFPNVLRKEFSVVLDNLAESQPHQLTSEQVEQAKSALRQTPTT